MPGKTVLSVQGQDFHVNGAPTYPGRTWRGMRIEGLLMNARLVQGIFDDANPETRPQWDYPDGPWDPERNNREFVAAMPLWREHGLISFTINFQGGSPRGYSRQQPWLNSAFAPDGCLKAEYLARMERILDKADELGMAPIVGILYHAQEPRLESEAATVRAVDNATDWLLDKGYANVAIEIANESDQRSFRDVVRVRCHELVRRVQERSQGRVDSPAGRLLVSASLCGKRIPNNDLMAACDFVLLHGNGVHEPDGIREMVRAARQSPAWGGKPILFNEDDHFDFDKPDNNMLAAVESGAGWGYFDFRRADEGEGYGEGYQSVPVNWGISSERKRGFFGVLAEMAGK